MACFLCVLKKDWRWWKINERQRRFADEYIISGNAYQSAMKAGYSEKYARTDSHKLLENTRIKKYINERLNELKTSKIADQTEIMEYLTRLMRGEEKETEMINVGNFEQELVEVPVKHTVRKQAAELLGKRYSMWTDKADINLTGSVVFLNEDDIED